MNEAIRDYQGNFQGFSAKPQRSWVFQGVEAAGGGFGGGGRAEWGHSGSQEEVILALSTRIPIPTGPGVVYHHHLHKGLWWLCLQKGFTVYKMRELRPREAGTYSDSSNQ